MSNAIGDIEKSKCLLVFGYNCADSHPIVARRVIKAKENGAKIIVCDPRCIETARIADQHLQLKNGCNMALVNAFAHVLLEENLYDKEYVAKHTEGLEAYREIVKGYAPEDVEHLTGVPAQQVRQAMRTFAAAPSATIMWGMGVTQFSQAVDVVKRLSSLALLTGNLGRENVGVFTCADRGFQRFEKAIEPKYNVKRDWEIISLIASEMGYPIHYDSNQQIWDEMRELCPLFYGVTYEKMGDMGHVQWPCPTLDHPGTPYLYKDSRLDTPTSKGQLFAASRQGNQPGGRQRAH
jgi:predicted molibdopterin-dependent oxidoreductase YjgC